MASSRPAKVIAKAFEDKGLERDENHHHMFRKRIEGVTTIVTRLSHGSTVVDDNLAKLMANQCCLQLKEFWDLVDCPLSEEDWEALIRQRCPDGRNPFIGH
jgi:hypothetical protein